MDIDLVMTQASSFVVLTFQLEQSHARPAQAFQTMIFSPFSFSLHTLLSGISCQKTLFFFCCFFFCLVAHLLPVHFVPSAESFLLEFSRAKKDFPKQLKTTENLFEGSTQTAGQKRYMSKRQWRSPSFSLEF